MIELINDSKSAVEAYVLFEKSQSAFQAFLANRNSVLSSPNLRYIVPANTWHQSDSISVWNQIDPKKCTISMLNDDCLLDIFKYLDLETLVELRNVCRRFRNLLNIYHFPKVKAHTIFVYHASVNVIRKTMKCIGPHLEHLYLRYHKCMRSPTNYIGHEHIERSTYKILQNIGSNLLKLTVRKPPGQHPCIKFLRMFVPIFCQITYLEWDVKFDCCTIQHLRELCPYLETLLLTKRIFTCKYRHQSECLLHWPSLKNIEVFQYMAALDLPCQRFFEQFIQQNPQLQQLKLTNVNNDLFRVITEYSVNLKYLEMFQHFDLCDIHTESTLDLLHNLTNLKVFIVREKKTEFVNDVENQIKCLRNIKHLELIVLLRNYIPPIWPKESFPFAHRWTEIAIDGNSLKLKIGDNSTNITFSTDRTTLVNIFNTINPKESKYRWLQHDVQHVFDISSKFFPSQQQSITFENIDCYQFIDVRSKP